MKNPPSIISYTDGMPVAHLEAFASRIEEMGYDSLWVTEFTGRDPYTTAAHVLARTSSIKVATGIANIYSHDAVVAAQNRQTLAELSGGRFVMGLGVSHPPMAEMHGLPWVAPYTKMRDYLDIMDATEVASPAPGEPAPIWIAANGPKVVGVVGERLDGARARRRIIAAAGNEQQEQEYGEPAHGRPLRNGEAEYCIPSVLRRSLISRLNLSFAGRTGTRRGSAPIRRVRSRDAAAATRNLSLIHI